MIRTSLEKLQGYPLARSTAARAIAVLASGAAASCAMPPYNAVLALFAGISFFYLIFSEANSIKSAFAFSWLFFFGYFTAGLWWISNALLVEGNEYVWAWPLAVGGLPAMLALIPAAFLAPLPRFYPPGRLSGFLGFIGILALAEWTRGHIFTGFPWNLFGYSWAKILPVAQIASVGGIYFLTLLTIFWAAVPGFLLLWRTEKTYKAALLAVFALLSWLSIYYYGHMRLEKYTALAPRDDLSIRLVQASIPQEEKWDPQRRGENLHKYLALSRHIESGQAGPTIIVWPETALSQPLLEHPLARKDIMDMMAAYPGDVYLATGILRHEYGPNDQDRYFNSLVLYDRTLNPLATYDKSHLVPFGEYIPLQKWIPLKPVVEFTGFVPGGGPQTMTPVDIPPFSPLVCYEIIFPGAVTAATAPRPEWIINVTNDGWYGDSPGPHQHLAMAVFRAIEEGVPVVRAANTGISAIIDPLGRIIYRAELMQQKSSQVALPGHLGRKTLYNKHHSLLFFTITLFLLVFSNFLKYNKNKYLQ